MAGPVGPHGVKGEAGPSGKDAAHRNWKQCAWRQKHDSLDIGLLKVLVFITNKEIVNVRLMHKFDQSQPIDWTDGKHTAFFSFRVSVDTIQTNYYSPLENIERFFFQSFNIPKRVN